MYCTPSVFLAAYDARRIGQLLSDSGTPVAADDIQNSAVLNQLLAEASEMVLAAAMVGDRYTADDLDELAASTTTGFLLRRLVADLTYGLLVARRGQAASDISKLAPQYVQALGMLRQIQEGEALLGFTGSEDEHPEAGQPSTVTLADQVNAAVPLSRQTGVRVFPASVYNPPRWPYSC